ncbi:flagellar hook-basal body complex protein FliE [Motilimonas pumila]|uniref:Flagellar hook-basal body complex protein FliE n=1 Tax=Motilimonas pumila TaxID=2303987 RepID=A0A418YGN7_9GAMM|nr:flagellar hook-basal body complex protein FliE [Motilimonas pumila]RJG49022.1 flagellar hook-basal body complex protein FliE [Motilimonas pumila]
MNINGSSLYSEMQALSVQAKGLENQSQIQATSHSDFGDMLKQAIDNVNGLQQNANELRTRFDMGDRSVSLGDVMIAASKSGVAFDATVQVRNKVVEAYKEIMSMPV